MAVLKKKNIIGVFMKYFKWCKWLCFCLKWKELCSVNHFFLPQFLFLFLFLSINYEGLESLDALPWILLQRSLVVFKRCYMVYWKMSEQHTCVLMHEYLKLGCRFTDFKTRAGNDQSNMTYLVCNCIKKCNDTWKATANSNTNDARKCNTENNKENIKTQEDYT